MDATISAAASSPKATATTLSFDEFAERFKSVYDRGAIYAVHSNDLNTRSEKRIRAMSGAIRNKSEWIRKMGDQEIRLRWAQEAKEQGLTEREIDYVFDELAFYADLHQPGSGIMLSAVEQVWQSDSLIDADLAEKLKQYAAILEDVPEKDRDYHPNTNKQVLNLVHPSLFPLIYKKSRLLAEPIKSPEAAVHLKTFGECPGSLEDWEEAMARVAGGTQETPAYHVPIGQDDYLSDMFCWLPTEFQVDEDGATTVMSYINNLHPVRHAALYPTIAAIFSRFVPMLEHVVTDMLYRRGLRVIPSPYGWFTHDEPEPEDYDASDYDERYEEWMESRTFIEPQPNPFVAPERAMVPVSLRGRRLQAIFKMSNIQLTPDNPSYQGGNWHVEAMANERIVATGLYYYDVENITESTLSFREPVDEELDYEQGDRDGVGRAYGIYDGEGFNGSVPLVQQIGSVEATNGRCIVFPNIYQHQVSGFELADKTKPGHRKILAFFFIDPTVRIPSTEIVPPQQRDWWADEVMDVLGNLPLLVREAIVDHVDFPISLEAAKELRLKLMEERSKNNDEASEAFQPDFYLCEH
ncbi:hypothetical protein GGF46_001601 [Coemansia sp. RSA 552]|nr:hypothetical protein GGF46_001601 [Coemansia sp. RSA 552]